MVTSARREPWLLDAIPKSALIRLADSDESAHDGTYRIAEIAINRGKDLVNRNRRTMVNLPTSEKMYHPAVAHLSAPSAKNIKYAPAREEIASLKRLYDVNKVAEAVILQLRWHLAGDEPDIGSLMELASEADGLLVCNAMLMNARSWELQQLSSLQPRQRAATKDVIDRRLSGQFAEADYLELKRVRKQADAEMRLAASHFSAAEQPPARSFRGQAAAPQKKNTTNFERSSAPAPSAHPSFSKSRKGDSAGPKAEPTASGGKH